MSILILRQEDRATPYHYKANLVVTKGRPPNLVAIPVSELEDSRNKDQGATTIVGNVANLAHSYSHSN